MNLNSTPTTLSFGSAQESSKVGDCWVVLKQLFGFEKWFGQKVNSFYWFLRVTIHFDVLFKHYEFVSELTVPKQQFLQIRSF